MGCWLLRKTFIWRHFERLFQSQTAWFLCNFLQENGSLEIDFFAMPLGATCIVIAKGLSRTYGAITLAISKRCLANSLTFASRPCICLSCTSLGIYHCMIWSTPKSPWQKRKSLQTCRDFLDLNLVFNLYHSGVFLRI